jgi:hypothetical protein
MVANYFINLNKTLTDHHQFETTKLKLVESTAHIVTCKFQAPKLAINHVHILFIE